MSYQAIEFNSLFVPKIALVMFEQQGGNDNRYYIERYDIGLNGKPLNAHPLTEQELAQFVEVFKSSTQSNLDYMVPEGILPENVLYLDPNNKGGLIIWYTKAQTKRLFFVDNLNLKNDLAEIPALLWCVRDHKLYLYALKDNCRPDASTQLYEAPFFNMYIDGKVCLGTVSTDVSAAGSLEEFIATWQSFFFDSYFSHPISNSYALIELWQGLLGTGRAFPKKQLKKVGFNLKKLLS
ncbi:MAG: PRTRC system protein B [Sphingobacterium sp.]|jgi:PRTRC genetic system protein B|uniref:PRTRC system protein B n=1 Tax=Sphingobacterium sp. TaxID=341027 RepID=UPI002842B9D0|nr:PRTRC system protein B [Sphingobacterium sp.]MDR3008641.1 PRTRC system protein B [Sphingobacterium sp.]